jgi:hypothetical protein
MLIDKSDFSYEMDDKKINYQTLISILRVPLNYKST